MKYITLTLSIVISSFLGACASITSSTNQPVTVTAVCEGKSVKGATCTLSNSKGQFIVSTPGTVVVRKAWADMNILCEKGDSIGNTVYKSSSTANTWGNILIGGGIGAIVDAGTGAGYSYPTSMNVLMAPPCDTE